SKTLLIQILAGMMLPSGGRVLLDNQDIHHTLKARASIHTLFEEDLLYERLTARANLDMYRSLRKLPRQSVDTVLDLVGLSDQARTRAAKLSATAQRRLSFARALLGRPALLLLDLPVLRTDMDTRTIFARLITQTASEGTAVLLTCEDLSWAGKFCTHILELNGGRVIDCRRNEQIQEALGEGELEVTTLASERHVPYKVPARKEDRIIFFDPGDILYATSSDGRVTLRTATEEATANLTLQELESRLLGRGFFKAHRAYLVNLQHIKAVIQYTRNSYTLLLNDEQETMIPLSKQCEKELQALLNY
ncbi:MAG: LytTR family transcriptional regulator DNA-binding domain-containing protein, partial [Ktedonobacteraceae bacterium]|nr:LytTR family transcriptional regulator DNA-binding domain-containing protein [Ktedonobacteraceae bacterium]